MILAIDTATDQAGVALMERGLVRYEYNWLARGNHSRDLDRVIRHVLALAALAPRSLTHLAVASGPGSFNGLRVGMGECLGLAAALHIPVVGVSTLDVIGFQAASTGSPVLAVLPAGREEVYIGRYRGGPDAWRRVGEYARVSVEEVAEGYDSAVVLAGEGADMVRQALLRRGVIVPEFPSAFTLRRSGFLAELGKRYFDANGPDQRASLHPLYLRRSSAEENRAKATGG